MSDTKTYDVVIVGAGISGALAASELTKQGHSVLILEAGPEAGFQDDHVEKFYAAGAKTPNAPWPGPSQFGERLEWKKRTFAPRPSVLDSVSPRDPKKKQEEDKDWFKSNEWYLLQEGSYPFSSTYERVGGGTTNHWLGTCLRFLPDDFQLPRRYLKENITGEDGEPLLKHARNWPITYDQLEPWYMKAEQEIGVSGNSDEFENFGGAHRSGRFPMEQIPATYLDQRLRARLDGKPINGETVKVQDTPQGRNSREYPTKEDCEKFGLYNPRSTEGGANPFQRSRCMGNTSCIPVCPILAKWDANAALRQAKAGTKTVDYPNKVAADVKYKSVACQVLVNEHDQISGIRYKDYEGLDPREDLNPDDIPEGIAKGKIYVVAAHAVETPKLLLLSEWKNGKHGTVANNSDQVGRNIMDHVVQATWGLVDEPLYPYRAPIATAGIPVYRNDARRDERAAYRIEIHNDGWRWPDQAPNRTVWEVMNLDTPEDELNKDAIKRTGQPEDLRGIKVIKALFKQQPELRGGGKWYGADLRKQLEAVMVRQIVIAGEPEALPLPDSRVQVTKRKKDGKVLADGLGIPRPEVNHVISEYTMKGFAEAQDTLAQVLTALGAKKIETLLTPNPDPARFEYPVGSGKWYQYAGAGHIAGTYRMGDDPGDSVINGECRSWDHENLYLLGSGVFPSLGTANPTLTIAALAIRAADTIHNHLEQLEG